MSEMDDFDCKWLTPLIEFKDYDYDWEKYNEKLYEIFVHDFIDNPFLFEKQKIQVRVNPKEGNYEHAFIHLTCTSTGMTDDPNDRIPDLDRCARIKWNREIIENYICEYSCTNCKKILYYEHYYKGNIRINLVFVDARFKVILEKRKSYVLLITGYYMKFNNIIKKEFKRYDLYKKQKAPLD